MVTIHSILFVSKITKLELLGRKFKYPLKKLINQCKKRNIYKNVVAEYFGHLKTLQDLKQKFPDSSFIKMNRLNKKLTQDYDLIISIGGDETFKYVLHHSDFKKLFLSIRSFKESEGCLSSYDFNQIDKMLLDLSQGNFKINYWQCIDLKIIDFLKKKVYNFWGMDTIYIGDRLSTHVSKYSIYYGNNKEYHKSSGVLVVTGVGSMGWYRAASKGYYFPSDNENVYFIVREIYQGRKEKKINIQQGIILNNQYIKIKSFMDKEGVINIDSAKEKKFLRGRILKIRASKDRKLKILVPK